MLPMWIWKLFSVDSVTDMPKSGQPCKTVKQLAGVGISLWESWKKLLQKWSLTLSVCSVSMQMLRQILASVHYSHPSLVNKLNNNNRHAGYSELVNAIPKHDVLYSDECAINHNLWSANVYVGSNKSQISTQNWNTICFVLWYGYQNKPCIGLVRYVLRGWANWHTHQTILSPML